MLEKNKQLFESGNKFEQLTKFKSFPKPSLQNKNSDFNNVSTIKSIIRKPNLSSPGQDKNPMQVSGDTFGLWGTSCKNNLT